MPEILTAAEAAAALRVSVKTVQRLVALGHLRRVPYMRAIRIPRSAVEGAVQVRNELIAK
jgi:excisionase family DNA binding protein